MGAVFYANNANPQGESAEGFDGGFLSQETPPTSTPPSSTEVETETEPEQSSVADVPHYTVDQVIMVAKSISPDCRQKIPGWVGYRCSLYEDAEPIFTAEYLENGVWIVTKTCPVNSEYDGSWNFYEDNGELVEIEG